MKNPLLVSSLIILIIVLLASLVILPEVDPPISKFENNTNQVTLTKTNKNK